MIKFLFQSDRPAAELARIISEAIYEGTPPEGIPYWDEGHYELSRGNDHKLYLRDTVFGYGDRYGEPTRLARVRKALTDAGCTFGDERES